MPRILRSLALLAALVTLIGCGAQNAPPEPSELVDTFGDGCEYGDDAPPGMARIDGCPGDVPAEGEPIDKFIAERRHGWADLGGINNKACYFDNSNTACKFPSQKLMRACFNWGTSSQSGCDQVDPFGWGADEIERTVNEFSDPYEYLSAAFDGIADAIEDFNQRNVIGVKICWGSSCAATHTLYIGLREFTDGSLGAGGFYGASVATPVTNLPIVGGTNAGAAKLYGKSVAHVDITNVWNFVFAGCALPYNGDDVAAAQVMRAYVTSVMTHEIYHAYGYAHFAPTNSIMYPWQGCATPNLPRFVDSQYVIGLQSFNPASGAVTIGTAITHAPY